MKNIFCALAISAFAFTSILTSVAAANQAVGSWRTTGVRCMKGTVSKAPTMSATVSLTIAATSYSAAGKVGGLSCNFDGPLTARGANLSFKLGNSSCPISEYLKNGFTGYQNGNRMTVRLPTSVADLLCEDQGGEIVVSLSR